VTLLIVAIAALIAWAVLLFGRGFFWLARDDDRDAPALPEPREWPAVAVLVPARDEEATVGETVRSVLAQDYPGPLRLLVVDDRSTDGTAAVARAAASGDPRFGVLAGGPRPPGWTGKLWALHQGSEALRDDPAPLLLLTDADIRHRPDSLRRLVQRALAGELALASLMVRLRCESPAERWFIPAFVFFFGMLFPFRWVRDAAAARTAAAAGGCVLLDRAAFDAAGGFAPIRGAVIDDCALARLMKARGGRIWLGLTECAESLRPYPRAGDIRRMVARTAYAQLGYSPALLAGTVAGLALVFLAPPLLVLFARGVLRLLGAIGWAAMALAYLPTLRRFGLSPLRAAALPAVAAAYLAFTLHSALAERRGRGGMWKGETNPRGASRRSDAALNRATAAD
jgi:hopene-associated glycosyltransferase HpnB